MGRDDDFQKRFDRITHGNYKPSRFRNLGKWLAAAAVIAALGWGIVSLVRLAADPLPKLVEIDAAPAPVQSGVYEKKFWLGHAVSESIRYENGRRNGPTTQFYPNGATFRTLNYKDGKLEGTAKEYDQKAVVTLSRRMGKPVKGAGPVRWSRNYRAGVRVD